MESNTENIKPYNNVFLNLKKGKRKEDISNCKQIGSLNPNNFTRTPALAQFDYILRRNPKSQKTDLIGGGNFNLPHWAASAEDFWKECDKSERKNGVLYRLLIVQLPRNTDLKGLFIISYAFVNYLADQFFKEKITLSWAMHGGLKLNDEHLHIMFSDRPAFANKEQDKHFNQSNPKIADMNKLDKNFIIDLKQFWLDCANPFLKDDNKLQLASRYNMHQTTIQNTNSYNFFPYEFYSKSIKPHQNSYKNSDTPIFIKSDIQLGKTIGSNDKNSCFHPEPVRSIDEINEAIAEAMQNDCSGYESDLESLYFQNSFDDESQFSSSIH